MLNQTWKSCAEIFNWHIISKREPLKLEFEFTWFILCFHMLQIKNTDNATGHFVILKVDLINKMPKLVFLVIVQTMVRVSSTICNLFCVLQ